MHTYIYVVITMESKRVTRCIDINADRLYWSGVTPQYWGHLDLHYHGGDWFNTPLLPRPRVKSPIISVSSTLYVSVTSARCYQCVLGHQRDDSIPVIYSPVVCVHLKSATTLPTE